MGITTILMAVGSILTFCFSVVLFYDSIRWFKVRDKKPVSEKRVMFVFVVIGFMTIYCGGFLWVLLACVAVVYLEKLPHSGPMTGDQEIITRYNVVKQSVDRMLGPLVVLCELVACFIGLKKAGLFLWVLMESIQNV